MMESTESELLRLRRSTTWIFVVLVPVITAAAGSDSAVPSGEIAGGWDLLWVRSIGFYGMLVLPASIAVLASLVWRTEHQGGNWASLMAAPVPTWRTVLSKAVVVCMLCGAMQLIFLLTVVLAGKARLGLPGALPPGYVAVSALVVVASVPLCAFQSALSSLTSSFAAPVAVGVVLTGACTGMLLLGAEAASLLPYGLVTQTTQMGSLPTSGEGTSFAASGLTLGSALWVVVRSLALAALAVTATVWLLERRDVSRS